MGALGVRLDKLRSPASISVVDGHESVDPDAIGWEKFEAMYCVRVPADIMHEALRLRSAASMFELATKKMDGE